MATEEPEEYDFVEPVDEDYNCSVCLSVLREPHLTICCGHHYCKACMEKLLAKALPCPLCKKEKFVAVIDRNVERRIRSLKIRCRNKDRGCKWVGEMGHLKDHLDPVRRQCQFCEVECTNGCGVCILAPNLEDHLLNTCPKRKCVCEYCGELIMYEELKNHHDNCDKFPLACPNKCSESSLTRGVIKQHLLQQCPLQMVDCEFADIGCSVKVRRKDIIKHMDECTQRHLGMTSRVCLDLAKGLQEKQQQIVQVYQQLQQKNQEVAEIQEKLRNVQLDLEKKLLSQQEEFHRQLQEKDQHLLLRIAEERRGDTSDIQKRVDNLETLVAVPPYYFTLTNFALHKRGTTQWMCPPFYTDLGGYKMAIEISANGEGYGKGSHVSVYIRIMRGEYDHKLGWPLRASVTIQLISQRDNETHYEMTTPFYQWVKVTDGVVGAGWGWDKFISHADLEFHGSRGAEFLKNDRLNFRVISVDRAN